MAKNKKNEVEQVLDGVGQLVDDVAPEAKVEVKVEVKPDPIKAAKKKKRLWMHG